MPQKEKLQLYTINDKYIKYLSQYDNHVSWNKKPKRPYIGIVLKIEKFLYFAPLYSHKEKYNTYSSNPSFMKVEDRKGRNLSIIRFSEMIPVPENEIELIDYDVRGEKYKNLLQAEINFINDHKINVYSKAKKMYRNITKIKIPFFINISCNYKLLEEKCTIYINSNN